jgi:2-polyprenyl-3-methyl-5-hydroxy-6-metoxy-1,4-benzoquinol methylase
MEVVKSKVNPATLSAGRQVQDKAKDFASVEETPHWLDETHPNYLRWKRARDLSIEKGEVVERILSQYINPENLKILDLGCGNGGTSIVLSRKNFVVSLEIDLIKLKGQDSENQNLVNANALQLPFRSVSFDIIILQDVIEHILEPKRIINSCKEILKKNGILYISTPNKFSIINVISDPHWGLPLLSVFKRDSIKKYFLRFFRKKDMSRKDIAQLFSLNQIRILLGNDFGLQMNTRNAVSQLFGGRKGILWSNFHLTLLRVIDFLKLKKLFLKLSNDRFGIVNKYFIPTFYITAFKKD